MTSSPRAGTRLAERIQAELTAARERISEIQEEAGRDFEELVKRREAFEALAESLGEKSGYPLQQLVSHFDNAEIRRSKDRLGYHGEAVFKHTHQYPATVTLSFDLAHDEEIRKMILSYRLQILPAFIEFEPSDSITFDLDDVDEERAIGWVDDKIVSFVNTYLKIQLAEQYQERNLVTDPVAARRISRNLVKSELEYRGHTYYFVSDATRQEFERDPERFVQG